MVQGDKSARLAAYGVLAAGVIPAAAEAGVIGQDGLSIVVSPGNPHHLDFGGAFGKVFNFNVDQDAGNGQFTNTGSYTSTFTQNQFVRRDNSMTFAPTGGWTGGSIVGYSFGGYARPLSAGFMIENTMPGSAAWDGPFAGPVNVLQFYDSTYRRTVITNYGTQSRTAIYDSGRTGPLANTFGLRGHFGFRFTNNGSDYHYGWVELQGEFTGFNLTILGWGINTTPNAPIDAGEIPAPGVGGLAALAMGAAGIRRTRREPAAPE